MPLIRQHKLALRLGIAGLAATAMVIANSGLALADAGYGPPPPPVPVPGGYFRVVTSQTVGLAGGVIGPLRVGRLIVTLRVPGHAFPRAVQITITEPRVGRIGNAGFRRYRALGGVGILVQVNGSIYRGTFLKRLMLTMSSRRIRAADLVVVWNGRRFVTVPGATERFHSERVSFSSEIDEDFAVLRPAGFVLTSNAAKAAVGTSAAAATRSWTGAAVLAEEFLVPAGSPLPGLGVLSFE